MKTIVFHADDLGMCHAANTAFAKIAAYGITRCGSVMVPCPWFPELASLARENPAWDIGVHLTLTSEWNSYRWGPISTQNTASGMMDSEGYFWRSTADAIKYVDPVFARAEMRAQIDRALAAGIDVTHLDSHMGTAFSPVLMQTYVDLAIEYRVPAFITHIVESAWPFSQYGAERTAARRAAVTTAQQASLPIFSGMGYEPLDEPDNRLEQYVSGLAATTDGLTHFLYHPAMAGDELTAIAPDHEAREGDLAVFTDPNFQIALQKAGVSLTGYRELRDAYRART